MQAGVKFFSDYTATDGRVLFINREQCSDVWTTFSMGATGLRSRRSTKPEAAPNRAPYAGATAILKQATYFPNSWANGSKIRPRPGFWQVRQMGRASRIFLPFACFAATVSSGFPDSRIHSRTRYSTRSTIVVTAALSTAAGWSQFAVSLGWRILKAGYEVVKSKHPALYSQMAQAEATWREFLLGDRQTMSPYENHLFFLDSTKIAADAPEKFAWYSRRAAGWSVFAHNNRIFTYAKLPGMAFVTSIHPKVLKGWKGTCINQSGVIASSHTIDDGEFWRFLLNDAKKAVAPATRSSPEVQQKWLQKAFQKDPKKFLESDTIQISTGEMVSHYKRRMAGMPRLVTSLIDVIGNQVAGTRAETVDNIWRFRKIFDALADLSAEEATKLDSGIQSAIDLLMATGRSTKYRLTANTIRITFIANHNSAKADQRAAIEKELAEIKTERSNNEIPLAVFSMNYEDDGFSFESGFMVPSDKAP